jgi:hypothetical protein
MSHLTRVTNAFRYLEPHAERQNPEYQGRRGSTSRGDHDMKYAIGTYARSASLTLKALAQATLAAITVITISVSSICLPAAELIGVASLSIATTTPAHATCLIASVRREDISDDDCLEAQRTGCVRHMLTPQQYTNCLAANQNKRASCVLNGTVRDDLSAADCEEARATGCLRNLLTRAQYKSCLDAQPVRR